MSNTPTYPPRHRAPSLPALIEALPEDTARPQQSQFTRARQGVFLMNLAETGEVRIAARAASVSHQTIYRLRRTCRAFRLGVDAALVIARERAEDLLASRAMHGVEEQVYYHGEVVATRRRYDARLLLAHLARLDKKAQSEDVAQLVGEFDAVVAAFEGASEGEGEGALTGASARARRERESVELDLTEIVLPTCADSGAAMAQKGAKDGGGEGGSEKGENLPLGQCNMRSMSRAMSRAMSHETDGLEDAEEEADTGPGSLEARLSAMEAARPEDAMRPAQRATSTERTDAIEWAELLAFEAGEREWWKAEPGAEEASSSADRADQDGTCEPPHSCRN